MQLLDIGDQVPHRRFAEAIVDATNSSLSIDQQQVLGMQKIVVALNLAEILIGEIRIASQSV